MVPLKFTLPNYAQAMKDPIMLIKTKLYSQVCSLFCNCNWMTLQVCDYITSLSLIILGAWI